MKFLFAILLFFGLAVSPVFAEDKVSDKVKEEIAKETPITKWIDAENALLDSLPHQNREVFFIFRNKHSVIRSVEIVKRDIKNAVTACGKENPDIRKQINGRFNDWEKAVDPVLKEANGFLAKELKEQEAFHVTDYKHVMKLNDAAYEFSESKITKTPVITMEACEKLVLSMNSTEDHLVDLLQQILLPEEVVRERREQAEKQKAKEGSET